MDVSTVIEAVTVYRRGAQVRRAGALPRGEKLPAELWVRDLPLSLEDASVRVRIDPGPAAPGEAAPFARDVRVTLDARGADAEPPPPRDEDLRKARIEEVRIARLHAHAQAQAERAARLSLARRPRPRKSEGPHPSPTATRLALLELRRTRQQRFLDDARRLAKELTRARERRIDLEERARRASSARAPKQDELRKAVLVTLGGAASASARLVVEYTVPAARWAPAYSLRIDPRQQRAHLAVRAVVSQRTGEDWDAVQLSLSTAEPQRFTDLPELASRRIGRAQPAPARRGWRAPPPGVDDLYADYDRAFAATISDDATVSSPRHPEADEADDGITAVIAAQAFAGPAETRAPTDAVFRLPASERLQRPAPLSKSAPMPRGAPAPPSGAAGYGGPPPQPAPATAPELRAQSMDRMRALAPPKRSSSVLGGLFDARSEAAAAFGGELLEESGSVDAAHEAHLVADDRMLAYANLRMPAADQHERGRLTLLDVQQSYLELVVSQRVTVRHQWQAVLERELADARGAADQPPPPRHRYPDAQGGFDYAYRGDAPVDVPSDGHFHAIPLTSADAPVELRHVVVPRESQDAFRYAEVPNPLDAPLLDGPADVYVGDDYLLTTDVKVTPPRGKLRLGLGVDAAVKVSRNTTFAEQQSGLMGGSLLLRHGIEVEVANHRSDTVDIEVRERIPSVRKEEEDIKVELVEVEPPWAPYAQEEPLLQGGYRWRVAVEPGKRQRLRAAYIVKIASKHELVGGNRRDR